MLRSIMSSWSRSIEEPRSKAPIFLAYKFDHEYTDASLKFESLKGLDKVKAECLRDVCAAANACFYLASMERTQMGSCEVDYSGYRQRGRYQTQGKHALQEVILQLTELKRLIDLNGSVLGKELPIDEADIVQANPFGRDPDRENFKGYTGNEGAEAEHFYYDTVRIAWPARNTTSLSARTNLVQVAVLVPLSYLGRFLLGPVHQGIIDTNSWYKRLFKEVQKNPKDEARRQELFHLAVVISQSSPPPQTQPRGLLRRQFSPKKDYFPAPQAHWPFEASIMLEDKSLFEAALKHGNTLSASVCRCIGKAMFLFSLPTTHAQ